MSCFAPPASPEAFCVKGGAVLCKHRSDRAKAVFRQPERTVFAAVHRPEYTRTTVEMHSNHGRNTLVPRPLYHRHYTVCILPNHRLRQEETPSQADISAILSDTGRLICVGTPFAIIRVKPHGYTSKTEKQTKQNKETKLWERLLV